MPGVDLRSDVRKLRGLPRDIDLVAAGFPYQDLSQAGRAKGITGSQSGLVGEVFRLIKRKDGPRWLLLKNVPFMLQLERGAATRHLTETLNEYDYRWPYRVVDARAFGLPQLRGDHGHFSPPPNVASSTMSSCVPCVAGALSTAIGSFGHATSPVPI